jgi:hypothetical protein
LLATKLNILAPLSRSLRKRNLDESLPHPPLISVARPMPTSFLDQSEVFVQP